MFLKRLETVGFKSFAERIQMDFVPGVTAVVGPNGSGKSNIIDSIRWVLGEQSAKSLRGQKMEDIIFQGSDTRKALNFAEVALILNNELGHLPIDYQEVNVTRRVYRSGDSEFFINKQACRLKDIVDLFMDTGLGRESFSIIGQGKIDEILSSKAEERRAVFEEAAGVLKYKQRKKKAEFKLMETSDNLDRVEDIIHEIEQQITPLELQAEKAKQYNIYKDELKETEVSLLVTEIEQLHNDWQQALKDAEENQLIALEKKTYIQSKEATLTKERNRVQSLEQNITRLQNELLSLTEQLEQCEGKRNVLIERVKHLTENKQKLEQDKIMYEERIEHLKHTITEEKKRLDQMVTSTNELQSKIDELENKLNVSPEEINEAIEDLKSDYIELLNEQAVLQNESKRLEEQLLQLKKNETLQSDTFKDSLQQEDKLLQKKFAIETELTEMRQKLEDINGSNIYNTEKIDGERMQYESMQQKLFAGNEQIAKLTSRLEMLEEMRESYQGFYFGAKEVLQAKKANKLQDVLGAVIDLIEVPSKFMTAMETVLGGQAQNIAVKNDKAARSAIQWLKKENKGRATFLPLQSITPKGIPAHIVDKLTEQHGFIDIAANLITVDNAYDPLATYLLGNVIVTTDLQSANETASLTGRKYRIVTLDGDMVYPGGSMSGGAKKKNNQSLFTREKEIAELKRKLSDYIKRAKEFKEKTEKQRITLNSLEESKEEMKAESEELKKIIDGLQGQLHDITLKYSRLDDQLETYRSLTKQQEKDQVTIQTKLEQLGAKQTEVKLSLIEKEKQTEKLTIEKQQYEQNEKTTEQQLHELKIRLVEKDERKKAIKERYEDQTAQYEEQHDYLSVIKQQLSEMMDEAERKQQEQYLKDQIVTLKQDRDEITVQLDAKQIERAEIIQKTDDEEKEIKGLYNNLDVFTKEVQQHEVKANRLDVTLENHLSSLQNEYRMTYERAKSEYDKVDDVSGAREKVQEIKTAIERLGTVNLGAIDEYKRLSERYEFLQTQQSDLLEAKQTLYDVIREMDEEMTRRFSDVFQDIQSAFTVVFKKLFGGGHAELTLTNPDNMLETGIDIVARPPGKKLKTLGLLSGGERALTAIALLFAILRVRPVPFCILDEVDAALDEANVERFGNYLKHFSEETQFIVITHRKGTMEEADALYGITMQESGVSRLVSVKLGDTSGLVGIS